MGSKQGRAGCDRSGDMLSYLEQHDGLSFAQACQRLDIDPQQIINYRRENKGQAPITYAPRQKAHAETSDDWRVTAHALSRLAAAHLRDEPLTYLLTRGLTEDTIKRARLGYYPHYKTVKGDKWGLPGQRIKMPCGIVIPWFDALGNVVCIRFRRLPTDESEDARNYYGVDEKTGQINRYRAVRGVSSAFLYGCELVESGRAVALFEGEIDALIAGQCDVCPCVATGSTSWARSEESLSLLAGCSRVLVCFDNDQNNAGERASTYWLDELSNATRHRPYWNDANTLALAGVDIKAWLELAFTPEEVQEPEEIEEPFLCSVCGMDGNTTPDDLIFEIDDTGKVFCPICWVKRQSPAAPVAMTKEQFLSIAQQIAGCLPACEILRGTPEDTIVSTSKASITKDYWQSVRARLEIPPYYHLAVIKNGKPARSKPTDSNPTGNIIYEIGKPMMSREEWSTLHAQQKYERPEEARFSHYKGGYADYCSMATREVFML